MEMLKINIFTTTFKVKKLRRILVSNRKCILGINDITASGTKKYHQTNCPDGRYFIYMDLKYADRRHYITICIDIHLDDVKLQTDIFINLQKFYIYADQGYMISSWLQDG